MSRLRKATANADAESRLGVQLPAQLRTRYLICYGFREDQGNAKHRFSRTDEDFIGSLVSSAEHMWAEWRKPDRQPFLFFGSSRGDECWGIDHRRSDEIIAFHHHMHDHYEIVGTDIVQVLRDDYGSTSRSCESSPNQADKWRFIVW